jgi:hypothetical protein
MRRAPELLVEDRPVLTIAAEDREAVAELLADMLLDAAERGLMRTPA